MLMDQFGLSGISIHAPRAGSDGHGVIGVQHIVLISIHAPRAGSDGVGHFGNIAVRDFNPRSPCGERQPKSSYLTALILISIHAPRAGSDGYRFRGHAGRNGFQSTLPVRGAT